MANRLRTSGHARSLLQDLEALLKVVDAESSPLARHLNEPKLGGQVRECQAIHKSLTQFSETASGLRYVGFIGHFSAGKSSTINSILGTERDVGLHPTDTGITFLTHKRNQHELIGASGARTLGVVTFALDNEDLLDFVFVDTPGSGDPNIVSELVRDFLPVCDRIVYMISATQPFTEAEIPILKRASEELSFIPVTFVVTRADEFRRDTADRLNAANIDTGKQRDFMARLRERLAANLPQMQFNPNDVVIVDNKSGYGIAELRRRLIAKSSYADDIPAKKIEYFTRRIGRAKETIRAFASDQLEIATELAAASEANARKYEEDISVSLNHLREHWQQIEAKCDEQRKATLVSLEALRADSSGSRSAKEIAEAIFAEERNGAFALTRYEPALNDLVRLVRQKYERAAHARLSQFAEGLRVALREAPEVGTAQRYLEAFTKQNALQLLNEDSSAVATESLATATAILSQIELALCGRMNQVRATIVRECDAVDSFLQSSAILVAEKALYQQAQASVLDAVKTAANSVAVYATALQASPNWLSSLFKLKIAEDLAAAVTNVIPPDVQAKEVDKLLAEFFVLRVAELDTLQVNHAARGRDLQNAVSEWPVLQPRSFSDANTTGRLAKLLAEKIHGAATEAIGTEFDEAVNQKARALVAKVREREEYAKSSTKSAAQRARIQSVSRRAVVVTTGLLGGLGPFLILLASPLGGLRMRWWMHVIWMILALVAAAAISQFVGHTPLNLLERGASNYLMMGGLIGLGGIICWLIAGIFGGWRHVALRLQNEAFRDSVEGLVAQFSSASTAYPVRPIGDVLAQMDKSAPIASVMQGHEAARGYFENVAGYAVSVAKTRADQAKALDADLHKFLNSLQSWYGENASKVDRCNRLVQQWRVGAVEPSLKVIQRTAQQLTELVAKVS